MPDIVTGLPPGTRLWLAMTNTDDGPATITEPPTVIEGAGVSGTISGCMENAPVPARVVGAPGARVIVVPETVMGVPPGTSV